MKAKELNPQLFGFKSLHQQKTEQVLQEANEVFRSIVPAAEPEETFSTLNSRRDQPELRLQIEELRADLEESQQTESLRIERLQMAVSRLEKIHNAFVQDITEKYQTILHRSTEQKSDHQKMQDLMERHSQLLKGYEVRMSQLQKLLALKEKEMGELQAHLNELKMELVRARRG